MENENINPNLSTRFATGSASDMIDSDDWDQVEDLPKPKVQHAMLTPKNFYLGKDYTVKDRCYYKEFDKYVGR